MNEYAFDVGI